MSTTTAVYDASVHWSANSKTNREALKPPLTLDELDAFREIANGPLGLGRSPRGHPEWQDGGDLPRVRWPIDADGEEH